MKKLKSDNEQGQGGNEKTESNGGPQKKDFANDLDWTVHYIDCTVYMGF